MEEKQSSMYTNIAIVYLITLIIVNNYIKFGSFADEIIGVTIMQLAFAGIFAYIFAKLNAKMARKINKFTIEN